MFTLSNNNKTNRKLLIRLATEEIRYLRKNLYNIHRHFCKILIKISDIEFVFFFFAELFLNVTIDSFSMDNKSVLYQTTISLGNCIRLKTASR